MGKGKEKKKKNLRLAAFLFDISSVTCCSIQAKTFEAVKCLWKTALRANTAETISFRVNNNNNNKEDL